MSKRSYYLARGQFAHLAFIALLFGSGSAFAQSATNETSAETPAPSADAVDPDFAAAIAADENDAGDTSATPVSVLGGSARTAGNSNSMNPDISFVLTTGAGGFINGNQLNQGGHNINNNGFTLQASGGGRCGAGG